MRLHSIVTCVVTALIWCSLSVEAKVLVNLDPATAVCRVSGSHNETLSNPLVNASGLTFNITFNPTTADLTGTVLLMEIGGTSNGSGLYLLDGVPVFVMKANSNDTHWPDTPDDISLSDTGTHERNIAVDLRGGALTANQEYSLAAMYNPSAGTLSMALDGGHLDVFDIVGSAGADDWYGNKSFSVALQDDIGNRGGLAVNAAAGVWDANGSLPFHGVVSDAIFWNQTGTNTSHFLVNLDVDTAIYEGRRVNATVADPNHAAGLTMVVTFTPAAADLTGTVLLMEIGGTSNGSGLYLIDGVPVFVTKSNTDAATYPDTLPDLSRNDAAPYTNNIAINHSAGVLAADTQYTVAAVYNPGKSTLELGVGGAGLDWVSTTGSLGSENWSGLDTLAVGTQDGVGNRGALSENAASGVWRAGSAADLAGVIEQATYWNEVGLFGTPLIVDLAAEDAVLHVARTTHISVAAPDLSKGLTFHVRFSPAEADLTGTVLLMEMGGVFNGSGLYLIDGAPALVSKKSSGLTEYPGPFNDLTFNDAAPHIRNIAARHTQPLIANGLYTLVATYDPANGEIVLSSGPGPADTFSVTGSSGTDNWAGDKGASVGDNNAGLTSRGGLSGTGSGVWLNTDVQDFSGQLFEALYWNAVGEVIVTPPPRGTVIIVR